MRLLLFDEGSSLFATCAGLTFAIQFCGFLVAYRLQTETFYDVLGGVNFLLLGILTLQSSNLKSLVSTALFTISRFWLLLFLAWRAHQRKGDSRFDGVKEDAGMFLLYWMVQATWVSLVSLPIMSINSSKDSSVSTQDVFWMTCAAFGILVEVLSDIQKAQWVQKGRPDGFCSVGLWRFSRHPNYFGEIWQWCCFFVLAPDNIVILSPLFTMWILFFAGGTGLSNAEGNNLARYYNGNYAQAFAKYRANTSILIPMLGYSYVPSWIRQYLLFEWKKFEYKAEKKKA